MRRRGILANDKRPAPQPAIDATQGREQAPIREKN